MLMLSHAAEVSRDDLYGVVTPDPTDTWRPVPHIDAVNVLSDRAAARGLIIKNEKFALLDGTLYGANGIQTRLPGAPLRQSGFRTYPWNALPGLMHAECWADGLFGTATGFERLNGKGFGENASKYKGSLLKNGEWHTSIIWVRKDGVTASIDGRNCACQNYEF